MKNDNNLENIAVEPENELYAAKYFQEIYSGLNKLKNAEKAMLKPLFLKAILTNNKALIVEVIQRLGYPEPEKGVSLCYANDKNPAPILEAPILAAIQVALAAEDEKSLLTILMNTFQSIPESSNDTSGIPIGMKNKKIIVLALLGKTDTIKKAAITSQLTDLSFDALLPAFRPSIGDPSYLKTTITLPNYVASIGDKTDISEFIVLTIGFLQSQPDVTKKFLQQLSGDYLFVDYESCLNKIQTCFLNQAEKAPDERSKIQYNEIVKRSSTLKEFDPQKNNTRRFFETRLSQYINGIVHSKTTLQNCNHPNSNNAKTGFPNDDALRLDTLEAVNKILVYFIGETGTVDTPRDVEQKISIFANGYKDTSKFSKEESEFIASVMRNCNVYKGRDRIPKEASTGVLERKFETSPDKVGKDTWNSAGGVMKGTSPTFIDAQLDPIRNMLVDTSQVDDKSTLPSQWSRNNNRDRAAYIGSVSGHTCNIVGMLDKYMKSHKNDPLLEKDVNLFLVQLVAVYAKRGYHGMLEVFDVLHDTFVQEIFETNGVKLNLREYFTKDTESRAYLEYAINDSAAYAQVLINKHFVKAGIEKYGMFNEKISSKVGAKSTELEVKPVEP